MKAGLRFIIIFLLVTLLGGTAVGLTDIGKVCVFSAISGVVTLNGQPVAHAKLVRTASKEREHQDETTTDENGYFSFPAMYERSIAKFLPMEFVASQEIRVEYKGQTYKLWSGVKRKPEENTESRGKPLVVQCQLEMVDSEYISVDGSKFFTLCTWDVEGDPPKKYKHYFEPGT